MKFAQDVIIRPLLTEKSMDQLAAGKYAFVVHPRATKPKIAKAVSEMFGVEVVQVNTMNMPGKLRRQGRFIGRRPAWKKAIVTLKEGQRIRQFHDLIG